MMASQLDPEVESGRAEARDAIPAAREGVSLQNVFFHLTKACNLRCSYCYFSAENALPNEMSGEEICGLWPDMVKLRPRKVIFTGGEPLLRPDVVPLIEELKWADPEHRITRCLNTNGRLVTETLARRLAGCVDEVRVSLDAMPARNDAVRGHGSFEAAFRALQLLYERGFEPKVLVTVSAQTLPDLEELICWLYERRFRRVNINAFRPIGRGAGRSEWRAPMEAVRQAVTRAMARCAPESEWMGPEVDSSCHCGVGRFLNIMPDGDVYPCHVLTGVPLGNVRRDGLSSICAKTGLLAQLSRLDFSALAAADPRLERLGRPGSCLGEVYENVPESPLWEAVLRVPSRDGFAPQGDKTPPAEHGGSVAPCRPAKCQ